jgi:hypothetical protein
MRTSLIGVIGARDCDPETRQKAYEVGKLAAEKGYGVVSGGLGGVMEAASEGCQTHGGLTVGIIPQETDNYGNPFLSIVIPTGMGIMRNLLVVRAARGIVAVNGRYGTLSEIAYALQLEKPTVGINTWDISEEIKNFNNAESAVTHLLTRL